MRRQRANRNVSNKAFTENENTFWTLFENSADAQLLFEGDIFVGCNSAALKMMGCSRKAEILGHHLSEFSPPTQPDGQASLDKARDMLTIALAKGSHRFECVHRRADGTDFPAEVLLTALTVNGKLLVHGAVRDVTDRERSLGVLRASEQRYRNLCQNVGDGFVAVDMDGRFIEANPAYVNMLGYSPEELRNLTYRDVTPEKWHAMEDAMVEQALEKNYSDIYQKEYVRKDGLVIPIELRTHVFRDEHGKPTEMWAFVHDVADRKRAEEALRQSEERFRLTFDQAPIGIALISVPDRRFARANKALCRFTGHSEEELAQRTFADITHPDDLPLSLEQTRRFLAKEIDGFEMEKRYVRKDGSVAWGRPCVQAVKDGSGRILCTLAMIQDITERKEADQTLRESEERYRTAIENSNDGVAIIRNDVYVFVNQKFLNMFGYQTPEELLGKTVLDAAHLHPEDRERFVEMDKRRQRGEPAPSRYEFKGIRKDGTVVYVETSIAAIVYQGGPSALVYLRDITEGKQVELRLRESEEAMKSLLNATNDVALLMDVEGTIVAANGVLAERLGRQVDELIGKNMLDLFPEELARSRRSWGEKVIESGKPFRFEDVSPDNRYFDSCMYPVLDGAGKVVRLAVYAKDITEAKRAGLALAESEARFKQLFDSMNDGISLRDARTFELVDANRRFCEMYGYTLEELKVLPRGALAANESVDERGRRVDAQFGEVVKGASARFELEARRKDGSTLWVEMNVERLVIGGVDCLLTISRDMTERKRVEEALKLSEEKYRSLVDSSSDAIFMLDRQRTITSCNQAFLDLFGYEKEDVEHRSVRLIHASDASFEAYRQAAHEAIRKHGTFRTEWDFVRKDGTTVHVESVISAIKGPDGATKGFAEVARDNTERKKAEEALLHSETKFRALFDSTSDAVMLLDENGFFECNKATLAIFGCATQEEFCKKHPSDFSPPKQPCGTDSMTLANQRIATAMERGSHHFEWMYKRADTEETFPADVLLNAMELDGKRILQAVVRDITERKLLEAQLVQAQKLESIGQLAAGIAHEINTPTQYVGDNIHFLEESFAGIITLTGKHKELLEAAKAGEITKSLIEEVEESIEKTDIAYLSEEIPKAIQQSLEGVERVTGIVRAMKEFSHPGTKEKELIDINKAIANTLTVSRNEWKYVADVVTDFDPSLPPVPSLPGEFNQVILNLIVNGAHAIAEKNGTSAKKGCITVSTLKQDGWAEIRIADTGSGIPEEIRSRIFDPFFTTKEVGKGTGQGLAIARSIIVDKHQGEITFDTVPGEGTAFIIRLPVGGEEKG